MLDIDFVLENKELIRTQMENRQKEPVDLDKLERYQEERKKKIAEIEEINRGRKESADNRDVEKGKQLKEELQKKEEELSVIQRQIVEDLVKIPNITLADVPVGRDENENVVLEEVGEKKQFNFKPKEHFEIGVGLGLIDSERAAKVSGSRFTYLKGDLVLMQFALIQLALRTVTSREKLREIIDKNSLNISDEPFVPILPPSMITPKALFGMSRLEPREDKYFLEADKLFLAGSAEHTLGAMHSEEVIDEKDLPLRYVGYSTAFRREAGSYGKDTKGILRQHQFDKLELESFTLPGDSKTEQDFLVAIQRHLMDQLKIPYRVVAVCTGDMGDPDLRQIDIESFMPGQDKYRETHSADLMGEYQARRLSIRYKGESGKDFVHMNDATLFAMGRILIAVLENYQQEDGSVEVPEVLRSYVGKDKISK